MEDGLIDKIYRSALKFLVPLTPEETYQTVIDEILRLIGAEKGSIFLEEGDRLVRVYASPNIRSF